MSRVLDRVLEMLSGACLSLEELHAQLAEAADLTRQVFDENRSNDYYDDYWGDYYDAEP